MVEVHVIGQLVSSHNFDDQFSFLRWSINSGSYWRVLEGFMEGQTQLSRKKVDLPEHSWNHPIDIHYTTSSLQGWPRLELQVWGVDWMGKCNISAYGFINIPSKPGFHKLTCSTWRPVGDFRRRIIDYISGYRMHLVDPADIITNGFNRQFMQTMSMGTITADITVILKNIHKYNLDI